MTKILESEDKERHSRDDDSEFVECLLTESQTKIPDRNFSLKKEPSLSPWCTLAVNGTKKNISHQMTRKASKKKEKTMDFQIRKDCKFCRKLSMACTFDCKNRITFVHSNDISCYIRQYSSKYASTSNIPSKSMDENQESYGDINALSNKTNDKDGSCDDHDDDDEEEEEKEENTTQEICAIIDNVNRKKFSQVKMVRSSRSSPSSSLQLMTSSTNDFSGKPLKQETRRRSMINLPKISPLPFHEISHENTHKHSHLSLKGTKVELIKSAPGTSM